MIDRDTTFVPLGAFCIALGAAALWIASEYPFGSVRSMGPGYVPVFVAGTLVALGLGILVLRGHDVGGEDQVPAGWLVTLRAMICVLGAITVFAAGIRPLGLAITLVLVVTLAGLAPRDARPLPVLGLAVALSAAACAVFVGLLGLQIAVLPKLG